MVRILLVWQIESVRALKIFRERYPNSTIAASTCIEVGEYSTMQRIGSSTYIEAEQFLPAPYLLFLLGASMYKRSFKIKNTLLADLASLISRKWSTGTVFKEIRRYKRF